MRYTISIALASLLSLPAAAQVPRVVTDIPPVGALVAQVMGDLGSPQVLLDKGANAHAFQLRPSQAADLAAAGLVVWIGPEMTPWLDRTLDGLSAAPHLQLLTTPGTNLLDYADADHDHEHADDHADEHADDHAAKAEGDDHADHAAGADDHEAHTGHDPHAWLDPANAGVWLAAIAAELSTLDPANAATYAANAATAQAAMTALDAELATTLAPAKGKPIVLFHDAYGYFAARYGLTIAGTIAVGDASSPGAQHLRDLQSGMTDATICIFPEANHDPKLVATMAEGTTARIGQPLDPEGSALPPGAGLYADMMRAMAATIAACVAG